MSGTGKRADAACMKWRFIAADAAGTMVVKARKCGEGAFVA